MRGRQPGRTKFRKLANLFLASTILVITACAAEPIRVEFPVNNPVNPEASEPVFMPPSNPFQADIETLAAEPPTDSVMPPETREEMSGPRPNHGMDHKQDNPSGGGALKSIPHGKTDDRHPERPQ
jgi:hypothetical protein